MKVLIVAFVALFVFMGYELIHSTVEANNRINDQADALTTQVLR
jgi:hypothetical protein